MQKIAFVVLGKRDAEKLEKKSNIKVGWSYGHIRKQVNVKRCYMCLGYGRIAWYCQGPDRRLGCYKCEKADHKAKACEAPRCFLCAEEDKERKRLSHAPGSEQCWLFREALDKDKLIK